MMSDQLPSSLPLLGSEIENKEKFQSRRLSCIQKAHVFIFVDEEEEF